MRVSPIFDFRSYLCPSPPVSPVRLSVYMRAPVCAALLVWVLTDAAARQFSEEEMAAVRYEHQLRLDSV